MAPSSFAPPAAPRTDNSTYYRDGGIPQRNGHLNGHQDRAFDEKSTDRLLPHAPDSSPFMPSQAMDGKETVPCITENRIVPRKDALGRRNASLRAVPPVDWTRFASRLESAILRPGQTLHTPGQPIERIYFPNSGLVSLLVENNGHESIEVAVVGNEGTIGALSVLIGQPSRLRALVQAPGTAMWMPAAALREEYARGGEFARWLLRYFGYLNDYAAQCALCNRLHSVEERLSRWLLQCADRLDSHELSITHDFISQMLGTRRSGVTVGLGVLHKAGLLDLSRGHIILNDRPALERTACSCYAALRPTYDSLWKENL